MTERKLSAADAALRERIVELSMHIPCGGLRGPVHGHVRAGTNVGLRADSTCVVPGQRSAHHLGQGLDLRGQCRGHLLGLVPVGQVHQHRVPAAAFDQGADSGVGSAIEGKNFAALSYHRTQLRDARSSLDNDGSAAR
jgi:hypothetical protein